jgi:hypothetical protein
MSYYQPLPSVQPQATDCTEERASKIKRAIPPITTSPPVGVTSERFTRQLTSLLDRQQPATEEIQSVPKTEELLTRLSGPLYDVPTTQSLVAALQATLEKTTPHRQPVVIPGSKKRVETTSALQSELRLRHRVRHGIVLGATLCVIIITLISLSPLASGQHGEGLFESVIKWAQTQQQNWRIAAHLSGEAGNPPALEEPPGMTLPKSEYIVIARQAAADAGIPPEYFVRQINSESGFNPNAVSPAGAVGIAQFMPSTAASLGVNPHDPVAALQGAARLMASYYKQYGDYAKALAAYNAGSGTLSNAMQLGGANWMNFVPAETRNYIRKVMGI